jgi:hypothetical protein
MPAVNPGPAIGGLPNVEAYISSGPIQRTVVPTLFTNGGAIGNGTLSFNYFPCAYPVTATRMDLLLNQLIATAGTTATAAALYTAVAGVYQTFVSTNTAGSTTGVTLLSAGSATNSFTWASNSAGNTNLSVSAIRPVSVPVNINMQPGEYLMAFGLSTTNSSVGLSTTALAWSLSIQADLANQTAVNYAEPLAATNASSNLFGGGPGVYSAATSVLPQTAPVTAINQTGANALAGNFAFVMRNY